MKPKACGVRALDVPVGSGQSGIGGSSVRCRQIRDDDKDAIIDLLAFGFSCKRDFWAQALEKLADHETPADLPRYGYLLESGGAPVGVLLLIFTRVEESGTAIVRCSVSSWYVKPEFRPYAAMLVLCALKHRQATYSNLTPAPMTVPILRAQGYTQLWDGKFVSLPVLSPQLPGARVQAVRADDGLQTHLSDFEARVLRSHAAFGCMSLVCKRGDKMYPFVFSRRRFKRVIPAALLVYCRSLDEFLLCAGTLGRYLARRGVILVMMHANGRIAGLSGKYIGTSPTFYFGAHPPSFGNLAFSECAMFGV